jgi:hypothetical protein
MAYNTIKLKKYSDVIVEHLAGGTIYPGMLLIMSAADTVVAHNDDAPVNCYPIFALEDELQGKGINDAYASGDPVQCWMPGRGDEVYALLEDTANVSVNTYLESNGSGYLQAYTSGKAVAVALEALDLSGSSGGNLAQNEYLAPFGYARRIKVRII